MHTIIDRRKNDKNKSSVNRRKFIKKVKDSLKDGIKDVIGKGNIRDLATGKSKKITIPVRDLDDPHFRHDGSGINDIVRPGNDRFVPGDKIKRPEGGAGGDPQASDDGEGDDDFTFHLTRDEFLDLFFEACELPDLVKKNFALLNEEVFQRSGFVSDGSPSQLNIVRSMRQAKARKSGLRALKNKKLRELEKHETALLEEISKKKTKALEEQLTAVQHDIEVLKRRLAAIPFIDPFDLKFNNWSKVQVPTVQATMICVMDVSGSMDEDMKTLAKTFFLLLYLFLERNYEKIDLVFVRYHSVADEVDEQEFYYGTQTGGTVTSRGLQKVVDIINERYPTDLWNIYVAHASDSDNFSHDNPVVESLLVNHLLPIVQYYAYVHVKHNDTEATWQDALNNLSGMAHIYDKLQKSHPNLACAAVGTPAQIYPVFVKLFERKVAK